MEKKNKKRKSSMTDIKIYAETALDLKEYRFFSYNFF